MKNTGEKLIINDVWSLQTNVFNTYSWYTHAFSDSEIQYIEDLSGHFASQKGEVGAAVDEETKGKLQDLTVDTSIRKSTITFIPVCPMAELIYRKLTDLVNNANNSFFEFDLDFIEPVQYTEYQKGEFYAKHIDIAYEEPGRYPRKLSFTLQLSDPSEYTGGDVLLYGEAKPTAIKKEKGTIVFFPSFLLHEVTPVTSGVRKSLVGWVHGPRWK